MAADLTTAFRELHAAGTFVMPNPWDVGSAKLLASLGFSALATTSSGHALTLGLRDQQVSRDQLLAHAESIATAVDVPLNVDAERCFADDPAGVAATVRLIGNRDLDEIIGRLVAYRDAGAEVVYAPGLRSPDDITRLVAEVGAPVNVLALPGGPSVAELAALGVRRISTGGMLAFAAYGALMSAARELQEHGTRATRPVRCKATTSWRWSPEAQPISPRRACRPCPERAACSRTGVIPARLRRSRAGSCWAQR